MGQSSGIDINEESMGNMPSRSWKKNRYHKDWYPGDTISIGIGQGYWTTTLIQLARAHCILTQNGRDVVPHLLKVANSPTGNANNIEITPQTKTVLEVKDPSYRQHAKDGMCLVINGKEGTGRNAFRDTKYTACGKSGTAQVVGIKQDAKYNANALKEEHRDNALFVAFAPKEKPTVLVAIIAENIGGGSKQAAPMARALLDDYFYYQELNTPPTQEQILEIKGVTDYHNKEDQNGL
jgi:penicillin-binding protein 2